MSILKHIGNPLVYNGRPLDYYVAPGATYPTDSLVARYAFEDNLEDSYGTMSDLETFSGSATWTYSTGKVGKSWNSNTTSKNVPTSSLKNDTDSAIYNIINGTYTIAVWLKLNNAAADLQDVIAFNCSGWKNLRVGGTSDSPPGGAGRLYLTHNSSIYDTVDRRNSTWFHVIYGYNGTNDFMYINNSLIGTAAGVTKTATYMAISLAWWTMSGEVDQLYFYNKALTSDERSQLYNGGAGI